MSGEILSKDEPSSRTMSHGRVLLSMMFEIKGNINITHLSLHILTLTTEFDDPEKC